MNVETASQIARQAYADLVTELVGEFPELQGTMGGTYARLEGIDERVALGLEEFYFPTVALSSPGSSIRCFRVMARIWSGSAGSTLPR